MATRSVTKYLPTILFVLAILTSIPIAWIYAVPIIGLGGIDHHASHEVTIFVHAVGGVGMLSLGAVALYIGWTRRSFRFHRLFGYSYLMVGSMGASAALVLSTMAPHKPRSLYVATGTLAVAWLAVALMAFRAARNRRFDSHRDWMIRSYVLSWTFVGCRMANVLSLFPSLGAESVAAQIWTFWIIPYLICEMALQWKRGGPGVQNGRDRAVSAAP